MRRWLAVLFAWAGYLVFARSMIYFIAFVGDFGVAKTVAGPVIAESGTFRAALVDLGLVGLFVVHHSVFARQPVKRRLREWIGELERSLYVWVSSLLTVLLMWAWRPLPLELWSVGSPSLRAVAWAGFGAGWLLALLSSFRLGHSETFGVRPILWRALGRDFAPRGVETGAMYAVIRHPMELGFLLGMWIGPDMTLGRALLAGCMTAYVLVGHRWEERELVRRHGDAYRGYAERTPAFVPSFRRAADRDRRRAEPTAD